MNRVIINLKDFTKGESKVLRDSSIIPFKDGFIASKEKVLSQTDNLKVLTREESVKLNRLLDSLSIGTSLLVRC